MKNMKIYFLKKKKKQRKKSKSHQLEIYEVDKISLLRFRDKRYIHDDRMKTLSYGHKDINYFD